MHKILRSTHKESNINILKARDYFFDKARLVNNRLRKICLLGPFFITVIGTALVPFLKTFSYDSAAAWIEQNLEHIVGIVTVVSFAVDYLFERIVATNLSKSNALRELYDVRVLEMEENEYQYHYSKEEMDSFIQKARFVKDKDSYEVWYREIFSDNDVANAVCAIMDNIIYTYHVYTANARRQIGKLLFVLGIFVGYCCMYCIGSNALAVVNPFILFLAMFDGIKESIGLLCTSLDLAQKNRELKQKILESKDVIMSNEQKASLILRCIQDVVVSNRENAIFIPKDIRNRYLDRKKKYFKNGNPYYMELDRVKNMFWGSDVSKPMQSCDFEIPSVEDEDTLTNMVSVHTELLNMLKDVKKCLSRHNLSFMLDGGTLLGTCRALLWGFLPWDDDLDIVIKHRDVEAVMKAIATDLGDKYDIQHCDNEPAYSPRLATFRIRQKASASKTCEKDSELYESYQMRGLFLDVYTYSPILGPRWIDSIYRSLFIHPLNKRIRKVETKCKISRNPKKAYDKFCCIKKRYVKRVRWYTNCAKNEKYVCYTPFYIHDTRKPGPYIRAEYVYGKKKRARFEDEEYDVPTKRSRVLVAFYGKKWRKSPLSAISKLTKEGFVAYSEEMFDASSYKHLRKVSIYKQ